MLELVFHAEGGSASVRVAESLGILLANGKLSADGGPVLAAHVNGAWHIGELNVTRITCAGPISLQFQNAGECHSYGPFTDLLIGNQSICTTNGPFARYNAFIGTWVLTPTDASDATKPRESITLLAA